MNTTPPCSVIDINNYSLDRDLKHCLHTICIVFEPEQYIFECIYFYLFSHSFNFEFGDVVVSMWEESEPNFI